MTSSSSSHLLIPWSPSTPTLRPSPRLEVSGILLPARSAACRLQPPAAASSYASLASLAEACMWPLMSRTLQQPRTRYTNPPTYPIYPPPQPLWYRSKTSQLFNFPLSIFLSVGWSLQGLSIKHGLPAFFACRVDSPRFFPAAGPFFLTPAPK